MSARRWIPLLLAASLAGQTGAVRAQTETKGGNPSPPQRPPQAPPPLPRSQMQPRGTVYIMDHAPDFELDGSNGRSVKLSSLRGRKVLLVFQPYKENLAQMRRYLPMLDRSAITLVGVCGDKQSALINLAKRDTIGFLMLADVTGDVSMMYGLLDNATRTVQPGMFLLDQAGVVRFMALGPVTSSSELMSVAASALPEP
jgi:mycoredoxin-dependent peroxiredoxin